MSVNNLVAVLVENVHTHVTRADFVLGVARRVGVQAAHLPVEDRRRPQLGGNGRLEQLVVGLMDLSRPVCPVKGLHELVDVEMGLTDDHGPRVRPLEFLARVQADAGRAARVNHHHVGIAVVEVRHVPQVRGLGVR
jgi:hypothetical protein